MSVVLGCIGEKKVVWPRSYIMNADEVPSACASVHILYAKKSFILPEPISAGHRGTELDS